MWCHILVFGMPVLGLGLFFILPWEQALPLYGGIVLLSVILYRETATALRLQVQTGREGMVGMQGLALTNIRSEGLIRIRGETWKAVAADPIAKGEIVRVLRVDGIRAVVERGAGPTGGETG